jgi:glycerol-3-phosphate dehydrogenase
MTKSSAFSRKIPVWSTKPKLSVSDQQSQTFDARTDFSQTKEAQSVVTVKSEISKASSHMRSSVVGSLASSKYDLELEFLAKQTDLERRRKNKLIARTNHIEKLIEQKKQLEDSEFKRLTKEKAERERNIKGMKPYDP